jgi:hypothetical protein
MNYSFYLFSKLFDVVINLECEYDVMYEFINDLFNDFEFSKYNNNKSGEYECIVKFLTENKQVITKQFNKL